MSPLSDHVRVSVTMGLHCVRNQQGRLSYLVPSQFVLRTGRRAPVLVQLPYVLFEYWQFRARKRHI